MALFDTIRAGASGQSTGYDIERSLRMNGSTGYLTRTPSSTGNRKVWTWSGWVKRGTISHNDYIFSCNSQSGNDGIAALYWKSGNNRLQFYFDTDGSNPYGDVNDRDYRDTTNWYHIVWQVDASNTTHRIWVNGEEETITGGQPPDYSYAMNRSGYVQAMGTQGWDGHTQRGDMYFAEVHFSDGNKYEASDFGEYDSETGQWVAKKPSITYGTNGFYLKFSDNSNNTAATIGKDSSGNGNNWTPNGISVSTWPDNDSVTDTPTNNFCTLNNLDKHSSVSTTAGNLETNTTAGGSHFPIFSSMSMYKGKYYLEYKCLNNDNGMTVSIMNIEHDGGSLSTDSTAGNNASAVNKVGFELLVGSGRIRHNTFLSSPGAYGSGLAVNEAETGMVAVDLDNGKIWWGKEGTWFDSGDPAAGSNAAFTTVDTDITWAFCFHVLNNNNLALNWGQHGFTHTPPTGFETLSTANLAEPTIKKPTKHFNQVLYTGNGSQRAITGYDFSPDWVWIKRRDSNNYHILANILSGDSYYLVSNNTDAESSGGSQLINGFNSDGFDVGTENAVNNNGGTYIGWCWDAGESTVTNNDGSVSSQVRANTTAGFSIVTFSGSGNRTIGHGLGVTPDCIIMKGRNVTDQWTVGHHKLNDGTNPWHYGQPLNSTASIQDNDTFWNDTAPTSSVFHKGSWDAGYNMIAFCFSGVQQYSKFGRYVGNGSTDGRFVYTGFQPSFIMTRRFTDGSNWYIWEPKRRHNVNNAPLQANDAGGEATGYDNSFDILSNGFKTRATNNATNGNGDKYIYIAFASLPGKYTRAL